MGTLAFKSFHATGLFLYPLKGSEYLWLRLSACMLVVPRWISSVSKFTANIIYQFCELVRVLVRDIGRFFPPAVLRKCNFVYRT